MKAKDLVEGDTIWVIINKSNNIIVVEDSVGVIQLYLNSLIIIGAKENKKLFYAFNSDSDVSECGKCYIEKIDADFMALEMLRDKYKNFKEKTDFLLQELTNREKEINEKYL